MTQPTRIPVSELSEWVPHRPPMVWVDAVVRSEGSEGECRVALSADAAYACQGRIRPSSYIEWIAQAFGFVQAAALIGKDDASRPERVFLAAVKNFELVRSLGPLEPLIGKELSIQVKKTHQIGPVALVLGSVLDWNGELLARAELKLFAG